MSVREIIRSRTFSQSLITSGTSVINGFLGMSFFVFSARILGPNEYGILTILFTVVPMLSDILDFGTNQSLVRFIPKYQNHPDSKKSIIRKNLQIKLFSGVLTAFTLAILSKIISETIFGKGELTTTISLLGLGVLGQLLFSFSTSVEQAEEKYWNWSQLLIGTNLLRLVVTILLFVLGIASPVCVGLVYVLSPLMGFLTSYILKVRRVIGQGHVGQVPVDFYRFNRWATAFTTVSSVGSRIDTLISSRLLSLDLLGNYGLANQSVSILPQISGGIGAVMAPKFASFSTQAKNSSYLFKSTLFTSGVSLFAALLIFPIGIWMFSLAGEAFLQSTLAFMPLLISMVLFSATAPVRDSILYYYSDPKFFFWIGLAHVFLVSVSSYLLIPALGLVGSGVSVLVGQIFILFACLLYIYSKKTHA